MSQKRPKAPARTREVGRIYLAALLKRPWLLLLLLIGTVGLQAVLITGPLFLKQIFNIVATGHPTDATEHALMGILFLYGLVYVGEWVFRRISTFTVILIESRAMAELSSSAFDYLMGHSQQFFSSQFTGTLTRRVRRFADAFETIVDTVVQQFIPTALFVAGAVIVLYLRNHILGLTLGLWALFMVVLQIQLARWRQPLRLLRAEEDSKVSGALADALSNQTTVTLFAGRAHEQGLFRTAITHWRAATIRSWTADEYIWATLGLFMLGIEVGLLWIAIVLWQKGLLTVGDFILIQSYLIGTFDRVVGINMNLRRFYSGLADASEMIEILDEAHGVADLPNATRLTVARGSVEFSHVDFGFTDGVTVLTDYNLSIAGGEKIALVGPSGAGKSTITKLLLRFYDPLQGAVRIDDQNIREVTQDSLREAIGYVPQEPILFHRTLMENIRYGKRDASDAEVIEAARKAHAHDFISAFPHQYDTYVGERGVKLSGGERQRVAIARAMLKNAPILVLDEATSSLDSESEHHIQAALDTLMQGKTVIVIAHRLSTIMKMDRIIVMEEGHIVAEGTHEKLLTEGGLYHKLWSIQAGGFLGGEEEHEPEEPEEEALEE